MKKLTLLLLTFGFFMSCESKEIELTQQELLIGEWIESSTDNIIKYKTDGLYEIGTLTDGYYRAGWYTVEGDTITYNDNRVATFVVESDTLYVDGQVFNRK